MRQTLRTLLRRAVVVSACCVTLLPAVLLSPGTALAATHATDPCSDPNSLLCISSNNSVSVLGIGGNANVNANAGAGGAGGILNGILGGLPGGL